MMNHGTGGGRPTMGAGRGGGAGGTTLNTYSALAQANTDTLLFSGLSGDHAKTYRAGGSFTVNAAGSIKIQPNSLDTNAKCQAGDNLTGANGSAAAMFLGGQFGAFNIWQVGDIVSLTGIINAATARGFRHFQFFLTRDRGGTLDGYYTYGIWEDTTSNLTSLKFLGGAANLFLAGSQIYLTELGT